MSKKRLMILMAIAALALVSVSSALPDTLTITSITSPNPGVSYFKIVTANGDWELSAGAMPSMCMGYTISGTGDSNKIWTTYDTKDPSEIATIPSYVGSVNWNKVNWIANHVEGVDWQIVQAALWKLDGASSPTIHYPGRGTFLGLYNENDYDTYMVGVNSPEAESFVPGQGQYYAALLTKEDVRGTGIAQPMLVRVYIPPNVPEFPTVALPIGMLIGVVGAVEYFRTKKE